MCKARRPVRGPCEAWLAAISARLLTLAFKESTLVAAWTEESSAANDLNCMSSEMPYRTGAWYEAVYPSQAPSMADRRRRPTQRSHNTDGSSTIASASPRTPLLGQIGLFLQDGQCARRKKAAAQVPLSSLLAKKTGKAAFGISRWSKSKSINLKHRCIAGC